MRRYSSSKKSRINENKVDTPVNKTEIINIEDIDESVGVMPTLGGSVNENGDLEAPEKLAPLGMDDKVDEASEPDWSLSHDKGTKVKVAKGRYKGEEGTIKKYNSKNNIEVEMADGEIRYLGVDDMDILDESTNEAIEILKGSTQKDNLRAGMMTKNDIISAFTDPSSRTDDDMFIDKDKNVYSWDDLEGKEVSYDGKTYKIDEAGIRPEPKDDVEAAIVNLGGFDNVYDLQKSVGYDKKHKDTTDAVAKKDKKAIAKIWGITDGEVDRFFGKLMEEEGLEENNAMQDYLDTIPDDGILYTIHITTQGGEEEVENVTTKEDIGGIVDGYDGELVKIVVTKEDESTEEFPYSETTNEYRGKSVYRKVEDEIQNTFPNPKAMIKDYQKRGEDFYQEFYDKLPKEDQTEVRDAIDDYVTMNEKETDTRKGYGQFNKDVTIGNQSFKKDDKIVFQKNNSGGEYIIKTNDGFKDNIKKDELDKIITDGDIKVWGDKIWEEGIDEGRQGPDSDFEKAVLDYFKLSPNSGVTPEELADGDSGVEKSTIGGKDVLLKLNDNGTASYKILEEVITDDFKEGTPVEITKEGEHQGHKGSIVGIDGDDYEVEMGEGEDKHTEKFKAEDISKIDVVNEISDKDLNRMLDIAFTDFMSDTFDLLNIDMPKETEGTEYEETMDKAREEAKVLFKKHPDQLKNIIGEELDEASLEIPQSDMDIIKNNDLGDSLDMVLVDPKTSKNLEKTEKIGNPMHKLSVGDLYFVNNAMWITTKDGKRYATSDSDFDGVFEAKGHVTDSDKGEIEVEWTDGDSDEFDAKVINVPSDYTGDKKKGDTVRIKRGAGDPKKTVWGGIVETFINESYEEPKKETINLNESKTNKTVTERDKKIDFIIENQGKVIIEEYHQDKEMLATRTDEEIDIMHSTIVDTLAEFGDTGTSVSLAETRKQKMDYILNVQDDPLFQGIEEFPIYEEELWEMSDTDLDEFYIKIARIEYPQALRND